jgi:uncharacterized membrane protein
VFSLALLLAVLVSGVSDVIEALALIVPAADAVTTGLKLMLAALTSDATLQLSVRAFSLQAASVLTKTVLAGTGKVTLIFCASYGPALVAVRV